MGKEDQIWEITRRGIQGAIDWEGRLVSRVMAHRGMDYNTCKEVAGSLPIMTVVREVCHTLKVAV